MGYVEYGISREFVERVKTKLKKKPLKEKVKAMVNGLTKYDLQDPVIVENLVRRASKVLNETLTAKQMKQVVQFVLDQRIDPKNTFHLIKLWGMFR